MIDSLLITLYFFNHIVIMIYVLLLENVVTHKQVYFIDYSPIKYDDIDLMLHFTETNIMTSTNYYFIKLIEWIEGDDNDTIKVVLEYINNYGLNDSHGRYNVIWNNKIINNDILYSQIKQRKINSNPFL